MSGATLDEHRKRSGRDDIHSRRSDGISSIAFAGGKGGVGTTTIAVEFASMAVGCGRSVVFVDLAPGGDSHYRLDVPVPPDAHTIEDLLPLADELDERVLERALLVSPCGLLLLPAARRELELCDLPRLIRSLAPFFDIVVVDAGRMPDTIAAAFASSDSHAVVTTPDVMGVGGAGKLFDGLDRPGLERSRVSVLLNRSLGRADLLSIRDVESYLETRVAAVLPEESCVCRSAGDMGHFVHPGPSGLAVALRRLYRLLA